MAWFFVGDQVSQIFGSETTDDKFPAQQGTE
jgi:hypothetical protein